MRYTLRQLEVFLATARFENVSRAAQLLAMSQSAASGALAELESQFDVQLFERHGKRLRLSELGHQLRAQAQSVLDQAQALQDGLVQGEKVGALRVGATLTIGNYLAVPMIAQFRQLYPNAQVRLTVANTQSIADAVANFDLDVGLVEGELNQAELKVQRWRLDELVVFTSPNHPWSGLKQVSDEQLLAQHWIVREPGSGTRQAFDRAMHGILPLLDIGMELQHTEAIKRAVESQLGVGCLSRISLTDAFNRGSLVPVAVPQRDFGRQLNIITHREKHHSVALTQWLRCCFEEWSVVQESN
ncbi:MAG: LysR family transcriptional regulator [Halioglobus sp.]